MNHKENQNMLLSNNFMGDQHLQNQKDQYLQLQCLVGISLITKHKRSNSNLRQVKDKFLNRNRRSQLKGYLNLNNFRQISKVLRVSKGFHLISVIKVVFSQGSHFQLVINLSLIFFKTQEILAFITFHLRKNKIMDQVQQGMILPKQ